MGQISAESWSGIGDFGGYVPGTHGLDSIIVGYYRGKDLFYIARVRNGFVPATRRQVFAKLQPLVAPDCPFVNLPEAHEGRWGDGLTAEDMKKCVWVRPQLVARLNFWNGPSRIAFGIRNLLGFEKTRVFGAWSKNQGLEQK